MQLIGCVILGVVLKEKKNDPDYLSYGASGSAALWLLLIIAYVRLPSLFCFHLAIIAEDVCCSQFCSKAAIINVGVNPGGGENGTLNPRGSSPFWVPFKPQTTDVAEIIPQIRAQMERAGAYMLCIRLCV